LPPPRHRHLNRTPTPTTTVHCWTHRFSRHAVEQQQQQQHDNNNSGGGGNRCNNSSVVVAAEPPEEDDDGGAYAKFRQFYCLNYVRAFARSCVYCTGTFNYGITITMMLPRGSLGLGKNAIKSPLLVLGQ
jgi:hypothetical protein